MLNALLTLALAGCGAGWQREAATPTTQIPPRKQVRVYHGGRVERWHAAKMTGDSITGIHWLRPIECDSCRLALPLAQVDSIEVGDPSLGMRKSMGLGYGMMAVMYIFLCSEMCGD